MEDPVERQRGQPPRRSALSVDEAAERLGLNRKTVYDAIRAGEIPSVNVGRRKLIPVHFFDRLEGAQ
jgi:excisionase family DNA binding protein